MKSQAFEGVAMKLFGTFHRISLDNDNYTNNSNNGPWPLNTRASCQQDPMKLEVLESFMTTVVKTDKEK